MPIFFFFAKTEAQIQAKKRKKELGCSAEDTHTHCTTYRLGTSTDIPMSGMFANVCARSCIYIGAEKRSFVLFIPFCRQYQCFKPPG